MAKKHLFKLHDYLVADAGKKTDRYDICMAGFILKNTLSENGGVTRGLCEVDAEENLIKVTETYEIQYRVADCVARQKPEIFSKFRKINMYR